MSNRSGRTPQELSVLIAVGTTAALIVQYPIGFISDHYGRRPVIIGTMITAAVVALFIGATPTLPFTFLLGLFFVLTAFQSPLYALGVGQTNDYVDRKDFVPAAAGLLFLWGVGACAGPTLIGFIMEWVGPEGLFLLPRHRLRGRGALRPLPRVPPPRQDAEGAERLRARAEHQQRLRRSRARPARRVPPSLPARRRPRSSRRRTARAPVTIGRWRLNGTSPCGGASSSRA
jgi:hypothetical protein